MYLGYNVETKRYGVLYYDLWENTGLHCGEPIQAQVNGYWIETRIEYSESSKHSNGWYLVNLKGVPLERLTVKYGDERDNKIIC